MEIQSIVCISLLQGMKNINFVMQDEEMRRVKEHIGNLNIKTVYWTWLIESAVKVQFQCVFMHIFFPLHCLVISETSGT